MTLLLDAGALIAIGRGDRDVVAQINGERLAGRTPVTHGGVIGQVWRGGPGQARLARALPAIEVLPLDELLGRRAGLLMAGSGTSDVVDAALMVLAEDGDDLITSDIDDLIVLAVAAGTHVEIIAA